MSELIRVPDIGSGEGEVIELFVKVGDRIEAEQSLLTLESDKASMEIPAPKAGVIKALKVKLGDRLKEGDELLELESDGGEASAEAPAEPAAQPAQAPDTAAASAPTASAEPAPVAAGGAEQSQQVHVPDIGSSGKARVIELYVKAGDHIEADQSLLTLESDKASMEIPSPATGVVESVAIKLNDEVGTGDLILTLKVQGAVAAAPAPAAAPTTPTEPTKAATPAEADRKPAPTAQTEAAKPVGAPSRDGTKVHAGPAVRQLAREFGVELAAVTGSGPKGRILKEDVQQYVKSMMQQGPQTAAASGGAGIPPIPAVDFSKFGEIEEVEMSRLMQIGAANLHRSWLNVPHVTQFESADITELEA
ncbi:MAG: biotin/lipoyl-containing protein, partial [Pseudomonadaceae bacterium]